MLNRALRNQNDALSRLGLQTNLSELPRQKRVLGIGKTRLQLQRAGLGIHLIDRILHAAFLRKFGIVGKRQRQGRLSQNSSLAERQILRLAYFETNPDGIYGNNGGQRLRRTRGDQSANRHVRVADQSADGRLDRRVLQIQLRRFYSAAQRFDFSL